MDVLDFLENSVYYPACEFDGTPIKFLGNKFSNFVYADYNWDISSLKKNIAEYGLKGYTLMIESSVNPEFLLGCNWKKYLGENEEIRHKLHFEWKNPFAKMFFFERDNNLGEEHGKKNITILYLRSEGITAYSYLYLKRNIVPKCLVSINPGLGFGGNFQGYTDAFRAVITSGGKLPQYQFYDDQCARVDYFGPIIRYYKIVTEMKLQRNYWWSTHFCLSELDDAGAVR